MFREFLSIFRRDDPLSAMGENFTRMLTLTDEMTRVAGNMYFTGSATSEDRDRIYRQDIEVNKLQRTIRKQVVAHLAIRTTSADIPYCLFLVSLVKDVERLGDYAKNLTEVMDFHPHPVPDDELGRELRRIREGVEAAFAEATTIVNASDRERALRLIKEGRDLSRRCDELIERIARGPHGASTTTALALGARYYKRIGGHVLNLLSSVVMPLHKLDYFDEDEIPAR